MFNHENIKGRVAVVTGGGGVLCSSFAKDLASQGVKVAVLDLREEAAQVVVDEIKAAGGTAIAVGCNVLAADSIEAAKDAVLAKFGKVDILINNAGVLDNGLKAIDSFTDDDMNKVIDINTKGTMCMTREVAVEMAKTGYGSIVNVASVAGVMGCGGAAYVASKAAVIGLTRHTALRFAGTNVRCNAICPGTIVTPMVAGMNPANMDMNIFGQMMKHNDLKVQPCMPEDVANMLLFFASDESRAITGQTLVTDFGSTL